MKIYPTLDSFYELSVNNNRIPILGEKVVPPFELALLFKNLFYGKNNTFLFESINGSSITSQYSFMGTPNNNYVRIERDSSSFKLNKESGEIRGTVKDGWNVLNFESNVPNYKYSPHFWGGWVGFIGYEAGNAFENLPKRKPNELELADVYFMQVDRLIVYDHNLNILKYIIAAEPSSKKSKYDEYKLEIQEMWEKIELILSKDSIKNPVKKKYKATHLNTSNFQSNLSQDNYRKIVIRAKTYISDGDIYQVNLSQRFKTNFNGDPLSLYLKLREVSPAPFSGFLKFSEFSIISSSPERLLKIKDDKLETRPIAGTRPRGSDKKKDSALTTELLLSEKERAEHLMLVDLERNDMGRVCQSGSVKVTELMCLEKYSHVSHIVSNIEGELKKDITIYDLLKSLFPGGTITGCPKIRCMEIVNELEPSGRGLYSGSFGYIGFSRQLDLNILIRTIFVKNGEASFHVGAGIVADSNPENEYKETLAKAAAMIEVLSDTTNKI